jgi:hypothetical protein
MGNLCNDNSKETNAYQEFLSLTNILVVTLPSRFLGIISKYNPKRPDQKYRLYTDPKALNLAKAEAVLVDNSMPAYYEFAKYVKQFVNKDCKFFVLIDDKYITSLRINSMNNNHWKNNKKNCNGKG